MRESEEDATPEGTTTGLADAKAAIVEIWRRSDDDAIRRRSMRALHAVLAAERAMQAADAFVLARTPADRKKATEELRRACVLRMGRGTT